MLRLLLLVAVCAARERLSLSFRLQTTRPQLQDDPIVYLPFLIDFERAGEKYEGLAYGARGRNSYQGLISVDRTGKPHSDFPGETPLILRFPNSTFLQKSVVVWMKNEHTTFLKFQTDDYKLQVTAAAYNYTQVAAKTKTEDQNGLGSCNCVKKNCACCVNMKVPELKFQHQLCSNISYNADTIGLDVSVGVDGHYVTWEVSARNPPPICFDVPGTREIAAACLRFEKLDVTKKHVAGCMEVELELMRLRLVHVPLGCFDMPI